MAPYGALVPACYRGQPSTADPLRSRTIEEATERGEGIGVTMAHCLSFLWREFGGLGDRCSLAGGLSGCAQLARRSVGERFHLSVTTW